MRIEPLTGKVVRRILAARAMRDRAAERIAARILADVERRGDRAVLDWSRRLDGGQARQAVDLRVAPEEILRAAKDVPARLLRAFWQAARNIRRVARRQLPRKWRLHAGGVAISQIVRPLDSILCYVPGGRNSLVSTLLMTAIPAQVAGVRRIAVACPRPNAAVLAAARMLGLREIYRLGGAQAIAAFAFGTETLPRVDMICGPGNRFVAAAKKLASTTRKIDVLAGPTELLVLADSGDAGLIAADLLAQAEHDPDAVAILVTTSRRLALAVQGEVLGQVKLLPPGNPAARAIQRNGRILVARSGKAAVAFANQLAPEHLWFPSGRAAAKVLARIQSAGSIFLGPCSAQPFGDYVTGANHVLPTSGRAAARGGLSAADFVKCITVQRVTRAGAKRLAPAAATLADAEGLPAHARAARIRIAAKTENAGRGTG